jgi:hypothetical protein
VVSDSGYFSKTRLVDSKDSQRIYRVSVPLDRTLFLLVQSTGAILDASGKDLVLGRTSLQFSATKQLTEAVIDISVK